MNADVAFEPIDPAKFRNPLTTAKGEPRASVELVALDTLWMNTGTLCNIECESCYIESSPSNDRYTFLEPDDAATFLDEIEADALGTSTIGLTGGEPFLNPHILELLSVCLARGYETIVLTNAMRPMMRPRIRRGLEELRRTLGERLTLRVSIDHFTPSLHDGERGAGSFDEAMTGLRWLADIGLRVHVAARARWTIAEEELRAGFASLFEREGIPVDATDRTELVLFPEMNDRLDVPEITTACWGILGVRPEAMMCASARMVVRRRGSAAPSVVACTLLPYDEEFELGQTLAAASAPVSLNHPHCARFCVLGGGSCSAG